MGGAPAAPVPGPTDRPARPVRSVPLVAIGIATLAIPFVAIVAIALTRPWAPASDLALMELRTHDVGGPHTPLIGAYSRFGWNHPGPLGFWLLALPYRLAGARPVGMLVGTAVLHAAAVAGCLVLARRRGGWGLCGLVALGLAVIIRGDGAGFLVQFWNLICQGTILE